MGEVEPGTQIWLFDPPPLLRTLVQEDVDKVPVVCMKQMRLFAGNEWTHKLWLGMKETDGTCLAPETGVKTRLERLMKQFLMKYCQRSLMMICFSHSFMTV